ncbi:MAG: hypothetical protein ABIQ15_02125 [Nocardioides sp.]
MTALHFGSMHPYEQALTLLLAVGPFVLLALVIVVRRRQADEESPLTRGSRRRAAQRER